MLHYLQASSALLQGSIVICVLVLYLTFAHTIAVGRLMLYISLVAFDVTQRQKKRFEML